MNIRRVLNSNSVRLLLSAWLSLATASLCYSQDYMVMISTVSLCKQELVEKVQYSVDKEELVEKTRYRVGEEVIVRISITNTSNETLNVPKGEDYYRPKLFRHGELVAYREEVSERIETLSNGRAARITGFLFIKPGIPEVDVINLTHWYGPLEPGYYQLSLQRIFFKQSAESNVVTFEVIS